ncbi:MAG: transposase [Pseudomonadota bacterium]
MSRPLRIEYEGAFYHVMNRGIDRQKIFRTTEHWLMFLELLKEISVKYFIELHAYCLMDNHYHLLIRTPLANLGRAMRHLDGVYTRRFNISETRDGSIFRGRYHAILIEEEVYLLQVSRYIHLNPVSAKICANPIDYIWSSYRYYINENIHCSWLKKTTVLEYFSPSQLNEYEEFILEGVDDDTMKFYKKNPKAIFGSEKFVKDKLESLTETQAVFCRPSINQFQKINSLESITCLITQYFNVNSGQLTKSKHGQKNVPRMFAIFMAKQYSHLSHQKIADYFTNINRNSISTQIKRFEALLKTDVEIQKHMNNLINLVSSNVN